MVTRNLFLPFLGFLLLLYFSSEASAQNMESIKLKDIIHDIEKELGIDELKKSKEENAEVRKEITYQINFTVTADDREEEIFYTAKIPGITVMRKNENFEDHGGTIEIINFENIDYLEIISWRLLQINEKKGKKILGIPYLMNIAYKNGRVNQSYFYDINFLRLSGAGEADGNKRSFFLYREKDGDDSSESGKQWKTRLKVKSKVEIVRELK